MANIFDELTPELAADQLSESPANTDVVDTAIAAKGNTFDILEAKIEAESKAGPVEEGMGEAALISGGRGVAKGIRGIESLFNIATGSDTDALTGALGTPSKEEEAAAFAPLEEKFPITTTLGEIAGEVALTAPIGGAVGGAVLKGAKAAKAGATALRFSPVVAAGVTEGAIIGAEEGQAGFGALVGGNVAAAAEALMPPIARRLKRFFGSAKPLNELVEIDGDKILPTAETTAALKEFDLSFDDIAAEAQEELLNPAQAATRGAFQAEGIEPASRTRIRPNVNDIQKEGFLLRQSDSASADEFRERVVAENEAIKGRFSDIANELGVTGGEGSEKLKSALFGIKSNMRSVRNQAYQDLADVAALEPQLINKIPLNNDRLIDGIREASEFGVDPSTEGAVLRAFEDFGLVEKGERQGGFSLITGDTEVEQLNLSNLHRFRKRINNTFDITNPKEALARKSVINAIDDIELEIVEAFDDSGLGAPQLIKDTAKRARQSVIDEKAVFSEADLIENLIAPKRAGLNAKQSPLVASSKVYNKIVTGATPVEGVRKLVKTLKSDGSEESLEALRNLQASTMLDLLDSSVQPSRKLVDEKGTTVDVFSGTRLNNRIKKIGEDKIQAIFSNNPESLTSLKRLRKIADATITPEEAIQRGSLPPSLVNKAFDSISRAKGVPIVGGIAQVTEAVQTGKAAKQVKSFGPSSEDLIDFVIFEDSPRLTKLLEVSGRLSEGLPDVAAVSATQKTTEEQ
jgi:DNA-binding transcriptional ArsR family regulator